MDVIDAKVEVLLEIERCKKEQARDEKIEALEYAADLVEMQIARKPYADGRCPSCDFLLPRYASGTTIQYPFCPFCGKALDWDGFVQGADLKFTVQETVDYIESL